MRIFGVFFLYFLVVAPLHGDDIEERLKQIPEDEKEKMDSFFDYAIKLGHAGHVLYFQNKPMCLVGISLDAEFDSKFREGWYAFKKFEKFFPHKDFIFNETIKVFPSIKVIHIYLINKKGVVDCVNEHSVVFEKILGRKVDGIKFLQELENGKQLIELIGENEILLGILLGYGEESSRLYYKKQLEIKEIEISDESYITLTSELVDGIEIFPVAFRGSINSDEACKINAKFQEEWKKLWVSYQKKNQDSTRFFLDPLCR